MPRRRVVEAIVIGLTLLAVLPLVFVFTQGNLHWLQGVGGTITFLVVVLGLLVGFFGGVGLAIVKGNPLWLITTASALCVGYVWILVATGMALGNMH